MKIHLLDRDPNFVVLALGTTVFSAGDRGDQMYAVLDGAVDILVNGQRVDTIEAGGIFGEMALIEDLPRSATAIVAREAKLVAVDRKRFLFMVQQTPFFALQLLSVVTNRLRRTTAALSTQPSV